MVVTDHLLIRIPRVDSRLEYLDSLPCKHSSFHAADELFCLARKHGATYYFYSSGAMYFSCHAMSLDGYKGLVEVVQKYKDSAKWQTNMLVKLKKHAEFLKFL